MLENLSLLEQRIAKLIWLETEKHRVITVQGVYNLSSRGEDLAPVTIKVRKENIQYIEELSDTVNVKIKDLSLLVQITKEELGRLLMEMKS